MSIGAAIGALLSAALGGFDQSLAALLALVALDYATGIWAAAKRGELSSAVGYRGIVRKVMIFVMVALANLIDAGIKMHVLRDAVICAYAVNEGMSLLENMDRLGLGEYIPDFLRKKIAQLRDEKAGRGK
jgi:toxin secretion/phage lysis holin